MGAATAACAFPPSEPPALAVLEAIEAPAALLDFDLTVVAVNEAARLSAADLKTPGLRLVPGCRWGELCGRADVVGAAGAELETMLDGIGRGHGGCRLVGEHHAS